MLSVKEGGKAALSLLWKGTHAHSAVPIHSPHRIPHEQDSNPTADHVFAFLVSVLGLGAWSYQLIAIGLGGICPSEGSASSIFRGGQKVQ